MDDKAATSLAHMYVWSAIQEILEGATDPGREDARAAKSRAQVVSICKREQQRCLKKYDAARMKANTQI